MSYLQSHSAPTPAAPYALERAQQLAGSRPQGGDSTRWHHEALQFGDLVALAALALRA